MALFACRQCCCVENTEYGYYYQAGNKPVLCSECHTGKWHNRFPRRSAAGMIIYHKGWLAYDASVISNNLIIQGTVQINHSFPYFHGFKSAD